MVFGGIPYCCFTCCSIDSALVFHCEPKDELILLSPKPDILSTFPPATASGLCNAAVVIN